jgi:hypothetical protein
MLVLPSGASKRLVDEYNKNQLSERSKIDIMFLKSFRCEEDNIWWYY